MKRFPVQPHLGRMLRQARDESGLTQQDAAKRAKITNAYLCHLEQGNCMPSLDLVYQFAEIYEVPVSELVRQVPSDFGQWLRDARRTSGMTRRSIAQKANITADYIRELEKGDESPSTELASWLARVIGVSLTSGIPDDV